MYRPLFVALLVGLPSLAAAEAEGPGDSGALEDRAREYWEARVARTPAVYDYYAPPEKGGPTQPKQMSEFGNIHFRTAEIEKVEIEGDRGVVHVRVAMELALGRPSQIPEERLRQVLREEWNRVDGVWYKKPIPRGLSRHMQRSSKRRRRRSVAPRRGARCGAGR